MKRELSACVLLMLTVCCSAPAWAQPGFPPGGFPQAGLVARILQAAAASAIPTPPVNHNWQAEESWGLRVIAIPDYERHSIYHLSANQGLLVASVRPGSPVYNAGIERGDLLIEIEGRPVYDYKPLCLLNQDHEVLIQRNGAMIKLCVKPVPLAPAPVSAVGSLSAYRPALPTSGPRFLTVRQFGHEYVITAIVDTFSGPTQVSLRGCEHVIRQQLAELPAEIRYQLEGHVNL
jgi:hypothetical protein